MRTDGDGTLRISLTAAALWPVQQIKRARLFTYQLLQAGIGVQVDRVIRDVTANFNAVGVDTARAARFLPLPPSLLLLLRYPQLALSTLSCRYALPQPAGESTPLPMW